MQPFEFRPRQLEKSPAGVLERVAGDRLEGVDQANLGLLQVVNSFGMLLSLFFQGCAELGPIMQRDVVLPSKHFIVAP
jgi:hypothetical protein